MAVFRVEKTSNFTVMSNHHFRNRKLSLKAMGLLSLMLSLPDTWDYSLKGLATICGDELSSVRAGINELDEQPQCGGITLMSAVVFVLNLMLKRLTPRTHYLFFL